MTDYTSTTGTGASASGRMFTVTAFYDNRRDAERAVEALVEEGFDRDRIRMMQGNERASSGTPVAEGTRSYPEGGHSGFWESLADLFLPERDRDVYAEGLNRGGYLVAVETTESNHDAAVDILDDEGTIDIDERADSWRSQGWTGRSGSWVDGQSASAGSTSTAGADLGSADTRASSAGITPAAGMTGTLAGTDDLRNRDTLSRGSDSSGIDAARYETDVGTGAARSASTGMGTSTGTTGFRADETDTGMRREGDSEQVIPVVEENLQVGKRDVDRGRVRVRSYVREVPATADVNLREEHVRIERRPADRPLDSADEAFRDRTIDVVEHAEEPVVSKEARIKEELVVNRDVEQRTEKVSDTVRRTEVEVEDDRAKRGTGTYDKDRR